MTHGVGCLLDGRNLRRQASDSARPFLSRLSARRDLNELLFELPPSVTLSLHRGLVQLSEPLLRIVPLAEEAVVLSRQFLTSLSAVISREEETLDSVPRPLHWAYHLFNLRDVRSIQFSLPTLQHAQTQVQLYAERVSIIHDNLALVQDYLQWYSNSMVRQMLSQHALVFGADRHHTVDSHRDLQT